MPEDIDRFLGTMDRLREVARSSRPGACHLCDGRGYTMKVDSDGHERAQSCACIWDVYLNDLYAAANIPRPYWQLTLEQWNTHADAYGEPLGPAAPRKAQVGEFIRKYTRALPLICGGVPFTVRSKQSAKEITHLALIGGRRSGKTMLASIIVKSAIGQGLSARFYDWLDLCSVAGDFDQTEQMDVLVREFSSNDVVVIDGVISYGTKPNPYTNQKIDRLARSRTHSGKPTILTCEPNYREFQTTGAWDSLVDDCYRVVLPTTKRPLSSG